MESGEIFRSHEVSADYTVEQQAVDNFQLTETGRCITCRAAIFERHYPQLLPRVSSLLPNKCDAEDVVQETFLRAFRDIANFRGEAKISTWLWQIAEHIIIDKIRYGHRKGRDLIVHDSTLVGDSLGTPSPVWTRPDFIVLAKERRALVEECVCELSAKLRSVFVKRAFEEWSEQEVADKLNIPLGTVKSRFNAARARVASCLKAKTGGVL